MAHLPPISRDPGHSPLNVTIVLLVSRRRNGKKRPSPMENVECLLNIGR
jgi:hypothetical protein